jgi:hypothetical protein
MVSEIKDPEDFTVYLPQLLLIFLGQVIDFTQAACTEIIPCIVGESQIEGSFQVRGASTANSNPFPHI